MVTFQSELSKLRYIDPQPPGRQLQKPPRGPGADPAHGEGPGDAVLDRYRLVVHSSDIDHRGSPLLGVRQKDSALGVDGDLLLDQLRPEMLAN